MKKILSIFLLLFLLTTPILTSIAQGANSDSASFFESTENLQKLRSYRLNQNITGSFEFGNVDEKATGNYYLRINTDILNLANYEFDTYSSARGYINVQGGGENRSFDNLKANVRFELKKLASDGLYIRLGSLDLQAVGVTENEMEDYLNFKKDLESKLNSIKGTWYYFPEELTASQQISTLPEELEGVLNQEAIGRALKENGFKETLKQTLANVLNVLASEQSIDQSKANKIETIIDKFFETELFTKKIVVSGQKKGFINSTLSKRRVVEFMKWVGETLEGPLDSYNVAELWNILNKFYFSIMTHQNDQYGIYDFFRFKLILKNIKELERLAIGYSYKVSKINQIETIKEPDEFSSYKILETELGIPLLPDDEDFDDFDF